MNMSTNYSSFKGKKIFVFTFVLLATVSLVIYYRNNNYYLLSITEDLRMCRLELKDATIEIENVLTSYQKTQKQLIEVNKKSLKASQDLKIEADRYQSNQKSFLRCKAKTNELESESKTLYDENAELHKQIEFYKNEQKASIQNENDLKSTIHELNAQIKRIEDEKEDLRMKLLFKEEVKRPPKFKSSVTLNKQKEVSSDLYELNVKGDSKHFTVPIEEKPDEDKKSDGRHVAPIPKHDHDMNAEEDFNSIVNE